ncbi:MAG: hypothetical protein ACRD7E_10315 [Bryobacteraceae bacterium]
MQKSLITVATLLTAIPLLGQNYEFGALGGGSFYISKTASGPAGEAKAGFSPGFTGGVILGQNMYSYIGGELRYSYLYNGLKLSSGDEKATFGGEAHAIHYDLLIHTRPRGAKKRPYIAVGGGAKVYRGTGAETPFQPLSSFALLTKTSEARGMLSIGAGIKYTLRDNLQFRVDVHDYFSPFPTEVITPVGTNLGGWIHNIVPTAGFSITF